MSRRLMEYLTFRPASENPTEDLDGRHVLVLNPCDGWHTGIIRTLKDNDEVNDVGIYTWMMDELTPHDFYIALKWSTKTGHSFRVFPEQSL